MKCLNCNREIPENVNICPFCGAEVNTNQDTSYKKMIKCHKCKKKILKNSKECIYCGAKVRRTRYIWLVICIVTFVLGIAWFMGYKLGYFNFPNKKSITDNDFTILDGEIVSDKITNVNDAIDELGVIGIKLGYENAFSELSELNSSVTTDNSSYYRIQQNYKGIPVYGRTAVIGTDDAGKVMFISYNNIDIKQDVSTSASATAEQIESAISDYLKTLGYDAFSVKDYGNDDLVIYTFDGRIDLAYKIYTSVSDNVFEMFIDACRAKVLFATTTIKAETNYQKCKSNLQGQRQGYTDVEISNDGTTNYLYDIERDITGYEFDSNEVVVDKQQFLFWTEDIYGKVDSNSKHQVTWDSNNTLDSANAVDAYVNVQKAYNYYKDNLNNVSTDGKGEASIQTVTNFQYSREEDENGNEKFVNFVNNAYSFSVKENNKYFTRIAIGDSNTNNETLSAYLDVIGHEYTHGVNHWHNGLIYSGESGAIDESLADIFGELIEYYNTKSIDWFHGRSRDMRDPLKLKLPDSYGGEYWVDPFSDVDGGGVHTNSSVLNHVAYLMWYGINGDSKKNLNEAELGDLWYRSLLTFPANCTFSECRSIVEMTAQHMNLSNYQQQCIAEAFDIVGIDRNINISYMVKNNFKIVVYDINGNVYDNYKLIIDNDEYETTDNIHLKNGKHTINIYDSKNRSKTYTFTVIVGSDDSYRDSVSINTNFGELKDDQYIDDINDNVDVDPSYSVIYDENVMEYQRMCAKDENYIFMKNLNNELERKNADGSAGDMVLYDEEFFTICGIDTSYIYLLKGSENDGVYDLLRVSKDGKKKDIILNSLNWCLHMDEKYFYYVPSDDNKSIRILDRETLNSTQFATFNEPVELLIEQENNYMAVTKENDIFALLGGAPNNYYLLNKDGSIAQEYGSNISVENYPVSKSDDGSYYTAIKYMSNGYLRGTADEVYIKHGNTFTKAEGISGWSTENDGVITTHNNEEKSEGSLPYEIVLYNGQTGEETTLVQVHSNQAFFTMCQDDHKNWWYFDQTDDELILYTLSNGSTEPQEVKKFDLTKMQCDLENCGMEIMDNRIYFYSMPDSTTANALYRYDLILED